MVRVLQPGGHVVEPVDAVPPPLSADEEKGIRRALASRDAGRVVTHDEVRRSVDELLQR